MSEKELLSGRIKEKQRVDEDDENLFSDRTKNN